MDVFSKFSAYIKNSNPQSNESKRISFFKSLSVFVLCTDTCLDIWSGPASFITHFNVFMYTFVFNLILQFISLNVAGTDNEALSVVFNNGLI